MLLAEERLKSRREDRAARALANRDSALALADGATVCGSIRRDLSPARSRVRGAHQFGRRLEFARIDTGLAAYLAGAGPIRLVLLANHRTLLDVYPLEGNPNDRFLSL